MKAGKTRNKKYVQNSDLMKKNHKNFNIYI